MNQEFSVVASGPIDNGYLSFENSDECICEKCDPNNSINCLCDENKEIGPICQSKIETLNTNKGIFTIKPLEIKRIKFISNNEIKTISSQTNNPGAGPEIWISSKCHLTIGEYELNGFVNNNIDINLKSKEICVAIFNNDNVEKTFNLEVANNTPNPPKPKKKKGSSSSNSKDNEQKISPQKLGNFQIESIYLGSSTIFDFQFGYDVMHFAREKIGTIIPPPSFLHTAIWVETFIFN